jgi:hypothetical protein|tara:strand:- start:1863 stop:2321 length:459 start_codon:yes stop_codon:yes gene_type:complete
MIENLDKLLNRMSRPLSLIETELLYDSNRIVYERSDLYIDFILTLNDLIETTYFGHDMMDEQQRINHYDWCWNKVCDLVNTKVIKFNNNDSAYVYLLDTYLESFYNDKTIVIHLKNFWGHIFNYNIKKSKPEIDTYLRIYKIFEDSYNKKVY